MEYLRFKQLRLNYINSQKKQTEKERLRLIISFIRVGEVAKTDDEFYISSTIKVYSYFLFVFSTVPKRVQLLKISKVMQLLSKMLPPYKNGGEEDHKCFGQSLLHPVVFQKRKYQVFRSSFGSCRLQLPDQLPYDCLNFSLEILPILQQIFTCLWKTAIKTLNLLSSVLEQLTVVLLVHFKKILNTFHTVSQCYFFNF